ncbi:MAG: T9SS type A sorting domain-containing protein, partial [Bacteroidales bacterium]
GGASWDQTWEIAPTKEDLNEVQKTLDYWTYQIINFNPESKSMEVETYSIGNKNIVHNNILIDSFTRDLSDLSKPAKPELAELPEMVTLPATIRTSDYQSPKGDDFNSCQFQISTSSLFKNCMFDKIRHFENLYEDEGAPYYIPVDTQKGKSALSIVLEENSLSGGIYYIRVRHRNKNAQWSDWSDTRSFVVIGDETTEPGISLEKNIYKLREPISIAFKNAPVGTKAWIGVYKHGTPTDGSIKSLKWAYTEGKDGSIKINGLAAGVYFAVLYADGGYIQISDKHPILVTNQDAGTLSVDRSVYGVGDEVKVEFANTPGYEKDWVGIYRVNDQYAPGPGSYKSSVYEYVPVGTTAGKASFKNASKLTEGDYFAGFFLKGGYEEVTPRSYFRIGAPAVLSIPEKQFNDHEYVPFMLVGKPLFPDVYLVITDAVTKTVVDKVRLGNTLSELGVVRQFPKGEYHAEVRIGDCQEPVSNAITFRVETGAGLSETVTGKVSAYPNPVADVLTLTGIKADRAELYALDGRLVRVYTAITDNKISLQSVDPGNYELLVIAGNKRTTFQVIRK